MTNQQNYWNNLHGKGGISKHSEEPTDFAKEVLEHIKDKKTLLDIGCGAGNDSEFFANNGFKVIATDFSETVVNENAQKYKDIPNLTFKVLDTKDLGQAELGKFDVAYARLSLHYFTDKETRKIIEAIHSILNTSGYLCFMCKSTNDRLYGQGDKLEENMYMLDGHVRHFFSEEYVKDILKDKFELIVLKTFNEILYGYESSAIKVIAQKI